ncbi:TetR/AcrR family transcriptional regulator [Zavarzinia compransoris]|uniref:TetR/AcrR family transcriptional regulator n=1 Tax=Zavarzinia compransoris TaxID=1264899 RepID=A0A317DWQ5_9PROT|nr:TetR/AcrR family transcriptional regulator [Zavarzinia compransoris]PWR18296.1 TetR/AcrR family transcriptional regulator [Zavarzinia compransoris]TDP43647.1 TetR family transcriptional regulator [Zavarzinia compransoris]
MLDSLSATEARIHDAALRLFSERGGMQVTIRELADAAGLARGTVYNNLPDPSALFESVAVRLGEEMHERVNLSFEGIADPAHRLANGLRLFIRRAHDEPHWGRFIVRFAMTTAALRQMWEGHPLRDLGDGLSEGRYRFRPEQVPSVLAMVASNGLAGMFLVLEGHKTWREAGSDAAELMLRAIGIDEAEARRIAAAELPPLPEWPARGERR